MRYYQKSEQRGRLHIMGNVFINFTNHPSKFWKDSQKAEALKHGRIVDIEFPNVDPEGNRDYIIRLAEENVKRILEYHPSVVLCQGEFCLAYHVITRLKEKGIPVVAACSERRVREEGDVKEVIFEFRQFREY